MESNFDFLEGHRFHVELTRAEKYQLDDPGGSAGKIRLILENAIKDYYSSIRHLNIRHVPIKKPKAKYPSLEDLIDFVDFKEIVGDDAIIKGLHRIRKTGNQGVHTLSYENDKIKGYLSVLHTFLKKYSFHILNEEIFDDFDYNLETVSNETQNENTQNNIFSKEDAKREEPLEESIEDAIKEQIASDEALLEKLNSKDKTILHSSVGITELMGKIWGRVFLNFSYLGDEYYAVKYFQNDGGAREKFKIGKGKFENIGLYTMFEKKHNDLVKENVINKKYDTEFDLAGNFPKRYGTPSILLANLINEIEAYFRNEEITTKFEFRGHYYKKEESNFRNILEIFEEDTPTNSPFELIVIMMNPGGSIPLSNDSSNWGDSPSVYHGVRCKPDETQYQIVKLMEMKGWKKAVVLNLFDLCNVSSREMIDYYTSSGKKLVHLEDSVFHEDRRNELESIFKLAQDSAPIVLGWGASEKLTKIKTSIFNKVLIPTGRKIVGWEKKNYQYYHPWPRINSEDSEKIRNWKLNLIENWPTTIFEQLKNS